MISKWVTWVLEHTFGYFWFCKEVFFPLALFWKTLDKPYLFDLVIKTADAN